MRAFLATAPAERSSVRARLNNAAFSAGGKAIEKFASSPGGLPANFGMSSVPFFALDFTDA
jgi:hypothetical protein